MSIKIRKDDSFGFALSFLDVLSCGLGAAILLLLIVKHGTSLVPVDTQEDVATQEQKLADILDGKLAQQGALEAQLAASSQDIQTAIANKEALASSQDQQLQNLRAQLSLLSSARNDLKNIQEEVTSLQLQREAQFATPTLEVEEEELGQTGQLGGIQIKDDYVVILLDRSASMLDHSLVEIIRLRNSDAYYRNNASKWMTAKRTAIWGFKHIGEGKNFVLLTFSDTVQDLDGTEVELSTTLTWKQRGEPGLTLQKVANTIQKVEAAGPTDLESAVTLLKTLEPLPRQILLITDGLPTVPGQRRLSAVKGCPPSKNLTAKLSSNCRRNIFERVERVFRRDLTQTEINVVLLPLEGDAAAVRKYWELASRHSGRVLAPAPNWPPI
ncbi:MAG: hypothetical protein F4039_06815 [Gammaproteobacteria bacterium]|nr:hypothetical protein [Gammaproteobacteria bacterium]MXX94388.1 hypothetical protein [Gammaproteobacteria bacterium]MYK43780.1 hypothetical protein [Gammaproteobacteria bacterium]